MDPALPALEAQGQTDSFDVLQELGTLIEARGATLRRCERDPSPMAQFVANRYRTPRGRPRP
jgi:hypothetical protein